MLGVSGFLTYGTFNLKKMILWNAGNRANMSADYIQEYNISKLLKGCGLQGWGHLHK
jgi:hypothetical protein